MGEARRRGTPEQRRQEGIAKREAREAARAKRLAEIRERRLKATPNMVAFAAAMALSASVASS